MFPSTTFERIPPRSSPILRKFGRYVLYAEIASGGMATVYFGRVLGAVGFARIVAIKRMHEGAARDPAFVAMLLDEAHLAARIRHPNVVPILDLVAFDNELALVLEYVHGESLARLIAESRDKNALPSLNVVSAVISGVLDGLHAAHEALGEDGSPLGVVHRDVSPHNIVIGEDGIARVLDFGVAKATHRVQTTRDGQIKGKMSYMAPEQIEGRTVDRRSDIFATGAVLWEMLTGRRLFDAENTVALYHLVRQGKVDPPSCINPKVPSSLDLICAKALATNSADRFASADDMSLALQQAVAPASSRDVGAWVKFVAANQLQQRASRMAELDAISLESVSENQHLSDAPYFGASAAVTPTRSDLFSSSFNPHSDLAQDSARESCAPSTRRAVQASPALLTPPELANQNDRIQNDRRLTRHFPAASYGVIGLVSGAAIVGAIALLRPPAAANLKTVETSVPAFSLAVASAALRTVENAPSAATLKQADPEDSIVIKFRVAPAHAQILADSTIVRDGLLLVPRANRSIKVVISALGFRSRSLIVSALNDNAFDIDLSRIESRSSTSFPPRPIVAIEGPVVDEL